MEKNAMTPEQQIKKIIHDNKLVDAAEIGDLEEALMGFKTGYYIDCPCQSCTITHDLFVPPPRNQHKTETLSKILSWLK